MTFKETLFTEAVFNLKVCSLRVDINIEIIIIENEKGEKVGGNIRWTGEPSASSW